jgi:hypothetical protein
MMHRRPTIVKRTATAYAPAVLRPALVIGATVAVAVLAAGCGGSGHGAPTTTDVPTTPATTTRPLSPAKAAACNDLVLDVQFISQLISNSVEAMATSVHPKQLAQRTGTGQQSLLVAVRLLERAGPDPSLALARAHLIDGLRRYAADFGRARSAVQANDMAKASAQLNDHHALSEVRAATKAIDKACGAA